MAKPAENHVFQTICVGAGLPKPEAEYVFAPPRKWRFDWAFVAEKVALEIDGGAWIGGRHTSGSGFIKDMEKKNAAALLGWRIFYCTPREFETGTIMDTLCKALNKENQQ